VTEVRHVAPPGETARRSRLKDISGIADSFSYGLGDFLCRLSDMAMYARTRTQISAIADTVAIGPAMATWVTAATIEVIRGRLADM
jgi:hypothetical protein